MINQHDIKAFQASDPDGEIAEIIFAKTNIHARKQFAIETSEGELVGISCKRVPWADKYYQTGVPALVMIGHGWHFECGHCYEHVDSFNNSPVETDMGFVFCGHECQQKYIANRRNIEGEQAA